ncbi:helix-turn-helix domain-containing protein [Chitinophaga silvisoli]|uniref:AraC family transcriptional regulator n=1 Tax=Chitinophaga silvisoli TaxID=2291814 RepID=A0A3E1NUL5_9BACT|nr:helix-turn-helix transcriptional regulator [Chitinophaga silvisoli]RFM31635.1 AraC family transcriptional regulator [Chitinophaga silvisoli]
MNIPEKYESRQAEITGLFLEILNRYMDDFIAGRMEEMVSLKQIAAELFLHPIHVTNVIKLHTGYHPCHYYEIRILEEARKLLADPELTITEVAHKLTYDKSQFTKFFRKYQGMTPSAYRSTLAK